MLEVRDVSVAFGDTVALKNFGLKMKEGEVMGVLGPSGCGKTTLLRVVAGLQPADSGDVLWGEESVLEVPPHRRGFGLMFQDFSLFPHRSVGGNVAFGLRMAGLPAERVAARVSEVLDWVGLEGYEERAVGPLSGGEQQRVALARSLAPAPRLLMLDEPVGSLDRTLRRRLVGELRELLRNLGVTAVYVTHDQEEAFSVADRVVVMRQGRVAQLGHPEEVWRRPVDEWVARFLGLDAVVEAEVKDGWAEAPWGRFPVPPGKVGSHRLLLRPDALSLSAQKRALSGVVRSRVFSGGRYLLTVDIVGGPSLELQVDCDAEADVGDMVGLDVDPARIVFLLGSGGVS